MLPAATKKQQQPDESQDQHVPPSLQKLRELSANLRTTMPELSEADKPQRKSNKAGKPGKTKQAAPRDVFSPPTGTEKSGPGVLGSPDFSEGLAHGDLQLKYEQIMFDYESLQSDAKKRQESYVRREVQFKAQIDRMKELLEKAVLNRGGAEVGMPKIRDLHRKIIDSLGEMKTRTQHVIEEHEKDMLRQFRVRLFDVEDKLKKEHNKKDDGTGMPKDWLEKAQKLAKDLDKYREEAVRLDRQNEILLRENNRLKSTTKTHEDDREFLLRQIVGLKKENSRLKKELEKAATSSMRAFLTPALSSTTQSPTMYDQDDGRLPAMPNNNSSMMNNNNNNNNNNNKGTSADTEIKRLNDVIKRLRKLLDVERRNLRELRGQHVQTLASRTELEGLLRQAVDEVKTQIAQARADSLRPAANIEDDSQMVLSREERERVLELLLSKERVLTLLYDKTFPPRSVLTGFGGPAALAALQDATRADSILDYFPELRDMEAARDQELSHDDNETEADNEESEQWTKAINS